MQTERAVVPELEAQGRDAPAAPPLRAGHLADEILGRELATNPKAALLFHWKSLRRQVRIRGNVTPVTEAEADAYFATRPKQAQLGAWASKQSQPLESRFAFEQAIALVAAKHIVGEVPRPPGWSGWRVVPVQFEFWHDRPFRLHDRIEFRREASNQAWSKTRLYP